MKKINKVMIALCAGMLLVVGAIIIFAAKAGYFKPPVGVDKNGNYLLKKGEYENIQKYFAERDRLLSALNGRIAKAKYLHSMKGFPVKEGDSLKLYSYRNTEFIGDYPRYVRVTDSGICSNSYIYEFESEFDFVKVFACNNKNARMVTYDPEHQTGYNYESLMIVHCYKWDTSDGRPGWIADEVYQKALAEHAYDSAICHLAEANALLKKALGDE